MRIAICALTYKRPQGLARLLEGLAGLTFRETPPELDAVIVDNDPEGSARAICETRRPTFPWSLRYVVEARRGIVQARNTALDNVGEAEWVCFIDDDESPDAHWLDELLRVQRMTGADVVGGAVLPCFSETPPAWVRRGRFFEYYRYPTGTPLPYAYTNNALFRAGIVREMNLRFDPRWNLTGGEDLHFFWQIGRAGYKVVWADEALVHELVPPSRVKVSWVLQRGYRCGNSASCIELSLRPGWWTRLRMVAIGCYRIFKGCFFLPLTWPLGRHYPVLYLRHICFGAGHLAGCLGYRYEEYQTTHGN